MTNVGSFLLGICFDSGFSLFAGTKAVAEPILVSVYCFSLVLPLSLRIISLDLYSVSLVLFRSVLSSLRLLRLMPFLLCPRVQW